MAAAKRPGVIRKVIADALDARLTGLSAEVTFYAMLSLFPALMIVAGMLGMLDMLVGRDLAALSEQAVLGFLGRILTDRASNVTDAVSGLFAHSSKGLITTAVLLGLWTLSSGFVAVIEALDLIYRVKEQRSWIRLRLMSLLLALAGLLSLAVLLITMVLGPLLGIGEYLVDRLGLPAVSAFMWEYLRVPMALALLVIWATTLYHLAPRHRTAWRKDLPGGVLASILWIAVSWGFGLYLRVGVTGNPLLGVLGGGLILMLWLYLLSLVLLLGGVLNAALGRRGDRSAS